MSRTRKTQRFLAMIIMVAMMTGFMSGIVNACTGYEHSSWSAPVIAVNYSSSDEYSSFRTFSKYDTVYFHFNLSGNYGEYTNITTIITTPDGERLKYVHTNCTDGYRGWSSWYYTKPAYGTTGYLMIDIYDECGILIGSGSAIIVD